MKKSISILGLLVVVSINTTFGQDVGGKTLVSQPRSTSANIGNAEMTIKYHSPLVNGRKIFGGMVPYDFVVDGIEYPWRAGSNQRTTMEFSHDVVVEGKPIAAGSYGFVVLISETEWTLIFSSGKTWGSFSYDPANDVIRVPVKTEKIPLQEWLKYDFVNPQSESIDIELAWETTRVRFNVSTDASANILADLSKIEEKSAKDYRNIAIWTIEQDPSKIDETLALLQKSLGKISDMEEKKRPSEEFQTKILMADLLIRKGEIQKGNELKKKTLEAAVSFNIYYYALKKYIVENKQEEAFQILTDNIKRNPESYPGHLAFGEYYLKEGNQTMAVEHFKKAYELVVEQDGPSSYYNYMYLQNKLILERM